MLRALSRSFTARALPSRLRLHRRRRWQRSPRCGESVVPLADKYANADGTKIHYVASGPAKGPLVVMIHGYPDYSESWAQLTPALNDAYRTVAIDTRGYNLSDKPKGVANYAMPKLVEDIQR